MTSTAQHSIEAVPSLPELLAGPERDQRAEQLTLPFNHVARSKRSFLRAAWTLRRNGVLVLRQAVEAERLQAVNREIDQLLEGIERSEGTDLTCNAILNLPDKRSIKGYDNFVDAERAVINYRVKRPDGRSGSDAGMVDIFHPERLSDSMTTLVESCLHERLIARLLLAASWVPMRVKCRNLYVNRGVQDTRGYHCDGRSQKFKSFVFLTDVTSATVRTATCPPRNGTGAPGSAASTSTRSTAATATNTPSFRAIRLCRCLPGPATW